MTYLDGARLRRVLCRSRLDDLTRRRVHERDGELRPLPFNPRQHVRAVGVVFDEFGITAPASAIRCFHWLERSESGTLTEP